jgi:hypothetical protein
MAFLYTPTTAFEIVSFDDIDTATARLKIQKVGCYHDFLQHELSGGELVGAPPQTICTTLDKMYGLTQIAAPGQPGHFALQVKSCFGQILSFRVKIDIRSETMTYYVTVNIYAEHNEFPSDGISVMSISMVPESQSVIQTNLVKEYPIQTLYSVGTVHHFTQFTWRAMAGRFNTFGSEYRIHFDTKKVSEIDSSRHIGSQCDLYGRYVACLSKKAFDKCQQIQNKMSKMINRVSAGQLKTNLVRIYIWSHACGG